MTVKKHLTLSQRIIIENGLREGKKISKIAKDGKVFYCDPGKLGQKGGIASSANP